MFRLINRLTCVFFNHTEILMLWVKKSCLTCCSTDIKPASGNITTCKQIYLKIHATTAGTGPDIQPLQHGFKFSRSRENLQHAWTYPQCLFHRHLLRWQRKPHANCSLIPQKIKAPQLTGTFRSLPCRTMNAPGSGIKLKKGGYRPHRDFPGKRSGTYKKRRRH